MLHPHQIDLSRAGWRGSSPTMQEEETSAHDYARALRVWSQWLRQWCRTHDPRAFHTAIACQGIAAEKLAIWRAALNLHRSALLAAQAERVMRTELALHKIMREIRRDERVLRRAKLTVVPWPVPLQVPPSAGDCLEEQAEAA